MLFGGAKTSKNGIRSGPNLKLSIHVERKFSERREIVVVNPKSFKELPNPLDGIELRAVWWEEKQRKFRLFGIAPVGVKGGVVISGVINDDHDTSTRSGADAMQVAQEDPTGLSVEMTRGGKRAKFTVPQSNGTEVAGAFSCRSMQAYRVVDLGWHPHPAATSVLLEMNFIHRPQVDVRISRQQPEFFLQPLGRWDLMGQPLVAACAGEIPDDEKVADIAAHAGLRRSVASKMSRAADHPTAGPAERSRPGSFAAPPPLALFARESIAMASQRVRRRPIRRNLPARNDEPKFPPFWAHRPTAWPLRGSSIHALPAIPRAGDDRIWPRGCDESRPVMRGSFPRCRKSLKVSWTKSVDGLCIMRNNI